MRIGGALLLFACAAAAQAAPALPEETLLAGLAGDLRHPGLRCEWIAARHESIDAELSLYREELAAFHVVVDGQRIADSASGAVLAVEFEARLAGPLTATVALDAARAAQASGLVPGQRVEIYFADLGNRFHPLFCGELAYLRRAAQSSRVDLVAAVPRAAQDRTSEQWQNVTCADVLKQLAASAGLDISVRDTARRAVFPSISRVRQAVWPFMRELGRQCRYDIVLEPGGRLAITEAAFTAPAPVVRQWTDMSLPHIVKQLAEPLARTPHLELQRVYPPISLTQRLPNEEFLASLAEMMRASIWYAPTGRMVLREDGVWDSSAPALTAAGGDALLWRITATGGQARSFTRRPADPLVLAADPERVPLMQTTLLLGKAMPAAAMPRLPLADAAATAARLDAALARLAQVPGLTPERRFLQAVARAYRPSLIHLYRARPDGLQALDAIGR